MPQWWYFGGCHEKFEARYEVMRWSTSWVNTWQSAIRNPTTLDLGPWHRGKHRYSWLDFHVHPDWVDVWSLLKMGMHPGRLTAGTYSHHPFRKENDLNRTSMIMMFHVNLQGWYSIAMLVYQEGNLKKTSSGPPLNGFQSFFSETFREDTILYAYHINFQIPFGKLTWQWKMDLLKMCSQLKMGDFPLPC